MQASNLLPDHWKAHDQAEFRLILFEIFGRPGQYADQSANPQILHLPQAGDACRVKVHFTGKKAIARIEAGPAFDSERWDALEHAIQQVGNVVVGRGYSFSSFRVEGSWRGAHSGVQILPPPEGAPLPRVEQAEHPFIVEFPVRSHELVHVQKFRWLRNHRMITFVLNAFLAGGATRQPLRPRHLWAIDPSAGKDELSRWVQEFYSGLVGHMVVDQLSPPTEPELEEVEAATYYESLGLDGRALRVPSNLDESICAFQRFSEEDREKFARAGFWFDLARRQWPTSASAWFASQVIAVEALGDPGLKASKRFASFLEQYAPPDSTPYREQLYRLRNAIIHGSDLLELDEDEQFGWSPPEFNEDQLRGTLAHTVSTAVRNWIRIH